MMMMEPPLPPAQEPPLMTGNHEDVEKSPSLATSGSHGAASEAPAELSKSARGLVRMCDLLLKKKQQRQRRQQGAGALSASPTGAGPPGISCRQKRSRTASSSDTEKSSDSGSSQDDDEEEEEVSEVESFILDQDDLENPMLETASKLLLSGTADGTDLRTVDPETQARLEALLEAAGEGFMWETQH